MCETGTGHLLCYTILYWDPEMAHTCYWDVYTGTVSTCCDGCVDLRSLMVKNVGAQPT